MGVSRVKLYSYTFYLHIALRLDVAYLKKKVIGGKISNSREQKSPVLLVSWAQWPVWLRKAIISITAPETWIWKRNKSLSPPPDSCSWIRASPCSPPWGSSSPWTPATQAGRSFPRTSRLSSGGTLQLCLIQPSVKLSLAFTLLSPASDLVPWWCPTQSSYVRSCLLPRASAVLNIWPRSLPPCILSVKSSCPARWGILSAGLQQCLNTCNHVRSSCMKYLTVGFDAHFKSLSFLH